MADNGFKRIGGTRRKKRKINLVRFVSFIAVVLLLFTGIGFGIKLGIKKIKGMSTAHIAAGGDKTGENSEDVLSRAQKMAMGYDYDGAIELLESQSNYKSREDFQNAVNEFKEKKSQCVAVDVTKVPHIFYHSLVNEPKYTFDVNRLGESYVNGHQTWMITTKEFDRVTQALYDNGYVYVRLHDLVVEKKNDDGTVYFERNKELVLPKDKKPIVLSIDDLSYYHTYEKGGYPTKIVIDENGKPKCEYTNSNGETSIGDYDVVPRLNTFLEEHPDGAYKGARGIIAMTGYNGCFGYRTDVAYKTGEKLDSFQKEWLKKHPDFNWDEEVAEAKKVADSIKGSGWEFASHTWGHISVTGKSADALKTDDEKWKNTVENIVGPTDTIIFAHGNDIGNYKDYTEENAAYKYYKSAGYKFYCNVYSGEFTWNQFRKDYVRQSRINIDGYQLKKSIDGKTDVLDKLFDAKAVYDEERPAFNPVVGKK